MTEKSSNKGLIDFLDSCQLIISKPNLYNSFEKLSLGQTIFTQ